MPQIIYLEKSLMEDNIPMGVTQPATAVNWWASTTPAPSTRRLDGRHDDTFTMRFRPDGLLAFNLDEKLVTQLLKRGSLSDFNDGWNHKHGPLTIMDFELIPRHSPPIMQLSTGVSVGQLVGVTSAVLIGAVAACISLVYAGRKFSSGITCEAESETDGEELDRSRAGHPYPATGASQYAPPGPFGHLCGPAGQGLAACENAHGYEQRAPRWNQGVVALE